MDPKTHKLEVVGWVVMSLIWALSAVSFYLLWAKAQ
jgi:hypothetical protein